ncbi:mismatch-specific DNA-glycosylase [Microbulbifer sp. JTAC008]|uniref:mismatch-specific DNA-glycosylase n=1 Tax=Microbulbifer sp. JTAC008 TaxID=3243374 RepID=UPI004039005E
MLPDLLEKNLNIVICGTAAGTRSAKAGQYYAGQGNQLWKVLYSTGLTNILLCPDQFNKLLEYQIGLTDLVKSQSGMDQKINFGEVDLANFKSKINHFNPKLLCFNGKKAAKFFFNRKKIEYGIQSTKLGTTTCFVAPSTSAIAKRWWDVSKWEELATL